MKKEICKIFKQNYLNITIEAHKKVDFLDITLDLRTGIYKLYRKLNSNINYLHKDSNHPPSIMKNLPKSIEIRLSNNSVNEETFKEAAGPYNAALKENGHNYTLKYTPNHNRHENSKAKSSNAVRPARQHSTSTAPAQHIAKSVWPATCWLS